MSSPHENLRTPVCVAGMHRSGTSLVARLLHACGVYLGREADLMAGTRDNRAGYWEHKGFVRINERVLAACGGAWDYPPPQSEVGDWRSTASLRASGEDAEKLFEEFAGQRLWGWKDPRNSLTLPFWQSLLPGLKVIICVRHPLEVALSLRRREPQSGSPGLFGWRVYGALRRAHGHARRADHADPPSFRWWRQLHELAPLGPVSATAREGYERLDRLLKLRRRFPMPYGTALHLWRIYNERALAATQGTDRLITHYDTYFADPRREVCRVLEYLGIEITPELVERSCEALLPLRHHNFTADDLESDHLSEIRQLYDFMWAEARGHQLSQPPDCFR